jgi:hypothetical protein
LPYDAALLQDGKERQILNIISADTILYVDSLQPNTTYIFQLTSNQNQITSNQQQVTTTDTTSHNITWQKYTFEVQMWSSVLYDIAIINENDIWIVGEIFINDSLGNPDPHIYNTIHWNGSTWEVKRISVIYNSNLITPPLYGIYAISSTNIWLSSGVPIHGDGVNWLQYHLFDMGILNLDDGHLTKIWGASSSDLYFVGTLGAVAHFRNGNWARMDMGTKLNIQDISGIKNISIDQTEIYCIAVDFFSNSSKLIKIFNNVESSIVDLNIGSIYSFWTRNGIDFYFCGEKLYRNNNGNWTNVELNTSSPIIGIAGTGYNDIYLIGGNQYFSHFNGITWRDYSQSIISSISEYTVVDATSDVIVAGGTYNNKVEIIIGHK